MGLEVVKDVVMVVIVMVEVIGIVILLWCRWVMLLILFSPCSVLNGLLD